MTRRISFDYGNTCPKIDKQINQAQSVIDSFICDLLEEVCPLLDINDRNRHAERYAEKLCGDLEDCFEVVRSTNEDMRREAERQIEALADQVANLERDLENAA